MKCIAYIRLDNGISIIYPTSDFQDKIEMIADKDTPSGLYYKIYNISDLPKEPQETWELNLNANNSDGIGLTKEEFEVKYPQYKGMAVQ